jgi:hypothetical protein
MQAVRIPFLALAVAAAAMETAGAADEDRLPFDPEPLVVPSSAPELAANPALARRLGSGPHSYFRGVNARFMGVLCERFASALGGPFVTLHGDAHVEQYAVTDKGRGLTDFDDSTMGPPWIDLARFATSIRLAMRERGWGDPQGAITSFQRGYVEALANPRLVAPEPEVARRLRAGFVQDREACLARAESLMKELPPGKAPTPATLDKAAVYLAQAARLPARFFRVKKVGALQIGIGSAADEKYLFRIEGPSPAARDDVILELKEVRSLPSLACLRSELGPTRILVAQAALAYEPFSYVGVLSLEGRHFWFHAWPDNYAELSIARSLESPRELGEVAFDAGIQLGRGHVRGARGKVDTKLREALRRSPSPVDLGPLSKELAEACEEAWRRFRARTK